MSLVEVTFDQKLAAVTISVDGSWPSTVDRIVIERQVGGITKRIRNGERTTSTGVFVISDIEMPLHSTVTYRVKGYLGEDLVHQVSQMISTAVDHCGLWMKKVGDPNATMCITFASRGEVESPTQGGVYDIAEGAGVAVAAWQGFEAESTTIVVRTKSAEENKRAKELFKTRVLLIQGCEHEHITPGWYYISNVSRSLRDEGALIPGENYTLPIKLISAPSGETAGVAGSSYDLILAKYPTYQAILDSGKTYFDLLQGV